jgi:mRNA interferase MazF
LKRGEVWTVSGGKDYAGKPRPTVVVQDDSFAATNSVTVCAFTTDPTDAPLIRLVIEPSRTNGLRTTSRLMVDKITTVPRSKLGSRIGRLDDADLLLLGQAMLVFLGLAVSPRKQARSVR